MTLRFLRNVMHYLCLFILFSMVLATIFYIGKDVSTTWYFKAIVAIVLMLTFGLFYYIAVTIETEKTKLFMLLLIFISVLYGLVWNIYAKTVPVSDYKILLEGAREIANGSFSEGFDRTSYFYIYNYQIGYVAYLSLLIKLFGYNMSLMKLMELIYMTGSAILIYVIAKKLVGHKAASIAAIIYSTFIFNIMGSSIINNQHLSGVLMLLGLYLLTLENRMCSLVSGIVFAAMNVVRPIGIIIIISVCIQFAYNAIKNMEYRKYIVRLLVFVIAFYSATWAFSVMFIKMDLTPSSINKSNIPYFKLVIGLGAKNGSIMGNQTTDARRTNVYYDLKNLEFNYGKYNDECLKFLKQRIKDPRNTLVYIFNKMKFFLGEKDHQYTFALDKGHMSESIMKVLPDIAHIQYLLLILFTTLALILKIKRKSNELNITYILLIGFISVHLFIEAQTRYRYEAYIFISILASESFDYFFGILLPSSYDKLSVLLGRQLKRLLLK